MSPQEHHSSMNHTHYRLTLPCPHVTIRDTRVVKYETPFHRRGS